MGHAQALVVLSTVILLLSGTEGFPTDDEGFPTAAGLEELPGVPEECVVLFRAIELNEDIDITGPNIRDCDIEVERAMTERRIQELKKEPMTQKAHAQLRAYMKGSNYWATEDYRKRTAKPLALAALGASSNMKLLERVLEDNVYTENQICSTLHDLADKIDEEASVSLIQNFEALMRNTGKCWSWAAGGLMRLPPNVLDSSRFSKLILMMFERTNLVSGTTYICRNGETLYPRGMLKIQAGDKDEGPTITLSDPSAWKYNFLKKPKIFEGNGCIGVDGPERGDCSSTRGHDCSHFSHKADIYSVCKIQSDWDVDTRKTNVAVRIAGLLTASTRK